MIRKDFSRFAARRRGDRLSKSACAIGGNSMVPSRRRRSALRERGAWTAAFRSVRETRVVPCGTSFPSGTISSPGRMAQCARLAPGDEQFPGAHGPSLSGAVRVGVRAWSGERAGRHPAHRADDRGSWVCGRLGDAASATSRDRVCCRGDWLGPRWSRCRATAAPSWARRRGVREG